MPKQLHVHVRQFVIGALVAMLGAGSYVIATVVFDDFQSGTTISAAAMNAKLNALKDAVNALEHAEECPANAANRFVDNSDGTICDSQTGLMWETKLGAVGSPVNCGLSPCILTFDVNNTYAWSAILGSPNGPLFSDFLVNINQFVTHSIDGLALEPFRSSYTDWRIPNVVELRSLLLSPCPGGGTPCIDPIFGPTHASLYWTASAESGAIFNAWFVSFDTGGVSVIGVQDAYHVRAVRAGR